MKIFLLFIVVSTSTCSNAYVLLQVKKGENQSNVDALIHKVVPTEQLEKIAGTARKQFDHYRYNKRDNKPILESVVVAIDSGAAPGESNAMKSEAFDRVIHKLSSVLQEEAVNVIPKYRTELEKYHIKPEIVHFKSGKPSVMFEINTKAVLRSIHDFLSSKEVKVYTDKVAHRAAAIYRSVRDELMRD